MSAAYDEFKKRTLEASAVIQKANGMRVVSDEYKKAFDDAMYEAREIFMKIEDEREQ